MRAPRNDEPAQPLQAETEIPLESQFMTDLKTALVPVATIFGWIADALPPLAALASILWIGHQWYYSPQQVARRAKKAEK